MAMGIGSGRVPTPNPLRKASGGNGKKLGLGEAVNPTLIDAESAASWRDELLSTPLEKKLWNLYVEEGQSAKLIAKIDVAMLSALCITQAVYLTSLREVGDKADKKQWDKLVHEKGGAYKGAMAITNRMFDQAMSITAQFGGMPGARAKLAALDTQLSIDFDALMDVEPAELTDEELDAAIEASHGAVARLR